MQPILIGIHGVKQSGKNAAASFIMEWSDNMGYSYKERGFADKLKWAIAKLFWPDISMEDAVKWCNAFKEDHMGAIIVPAYVRAPIDGQEDHLSVTIRELLQRMGTEVGRDMFGMTFWLDQLLPLAGNTTPASLDSWWHSNFELADVCVITDERFENENRRVRLRGVNWKIRRDSAEQKVIEEAKAQGRDIHRSELLMPDEMFDHIIYNNSSIADLGQQVYEGISKLQEAKTK